MAAVSRRGRTATGKACQERVGTWVERIGEPAEAPIGPEAFAIELTQHSDQWVVVHLFTDPFSHVGVL